MVIYDLSCAGGHHFEGWFESAEDFAAQLQAAQLSCPVCGSDDLRKQPHASARVAGRQETAVQNLAEMQLKVRETLQQLAAHVRANSEDVGGDFPSEARRIHQGEAPARSIRGSASDQEERELRDEGVPFMKVPLPEPDA